MKYVKIEKRDETLIRTDSIERGSLKWIMSCTALLLLSSCVNVAAPDQPIVINLNIKIEQEILIKQAKAVEAAIEENAGIF